MGNSDVSAIDITQLRERQNSLQDDIMSLSAAVTTKFAEVNSNVSSNFTDIRSALSALSTKFEERGKAPWTLLISFGSFLILFLGVIGGLAYAPIQNNEVRLAQTLEKLSDNIVTGKQSRNL